MWTGLYVFEVVRYNTEKDGGQNSGRYQHIGYMQAKFKTETDCCSYYDRHNPHMRKLNAHDGMYASDWDPKTKLLYIVRKDYGLKDVILPFSNEDIPIGGVYKHLK